MGIISGLAGAAAGGGGARGSRDRTDATRGAWGGINFGGMTNPTTGVIDVTTCEDGSTVKVPDDIIDDTTIPSPGTGFD